MFKNYFKLAFRNFWKSKTVSALNIFGLAMGIACAGLIFLWAEDELHFDNMHLKKERLYQLEVNMNIDGYNFTMGSTPRPMGAAMKSEIPGIARTAKYQDQDKRLLFSVGERTFYSAGRYCDAELFNMFSFEFTQGNSKNPFPQLYSMVITEKTAKKLFGTEKNILGKSVRADNAHDYIISGVIRDLPENSTLQFEWVAPYQIIDAESLAKGGSSDSENWDGYGPFTFVELDKNADLASINGKLENFIHQKSPSQKTRTFLYPMKYWRLYDEFKNGKPTGGGRISQLRMLSAIASIILLIACINFMNLATANSQKRAKEVGVRKVLGSDRKRLVIQFMSEAFLMSLLATLLSILIMELSLPAFNSLMQKNITLNLSDPLHIISLFSIATFCGLVAGSYPSIYLSSFNPIIAIKGSKIKTSSAPLIRKGLVILQFAASVVFIISTLVVYLQIQHIKSRDLGFNKNNLLEINPQRDVWALFPLIKQDLIRTGLVENAALADHQTLYGGDTDDGFRWQGMQAENKVGVAHRNVSSGYISTSGMKISEGRDFSGDNVAEHSNVIINESLARLLGKGSPVGKIIQSPRGMPEGQFRNVTVIGVVINYVYGNMYGQASPLILFCDAPEYSDFIYIRLKEQTGAEQAMDKIEEVMKKNNPAYPLEYRFVDDQFNRMFQNESLTSKVSALFAMLAIIISCLGLFGLAAYTAEQRTKEIGIRKVLGASISSITTLLSGEFLQLVAVSCTLAFPVAWWIMHNWLQNFAYRISVGWWIFLLSGALAILIALATICSQAIRAAIANPVRSLRTE